jgi:DNA-binding transcriptional LysR family regulator
MTLHHLKIFLAVCDQGSMTGAARVLNMSQPPISQVISDLERHYGARLFERLGRGIAISPAGMELRAYAAHILALADEAAEKLREREQNGPLRIGASMTVGAILLPDLLHDYAAEHPATRFLVTVANSHEILSDMEAARLDVGFIEGGGVPPSIECLPLLEDELVLITKPGWFNPADFPIPAGRLQDQCFYVREAGSGTRGIFEAAMEGAGIVYRTAGVINEPSAILRLVSLGLGMAFLSRLLVTKPLADGLVDVVPVQSLRVSRQISLVYHRNKFFSPLLNDFIRVTRQYWQ